MGEISYRPLIEDMTWSYSRIKAFEDCPYRWFLKYIKKMPETPQFYSSYGSFVHKLIEQYYKGELQKEDLKMEFLLNFSKSVLGERPAESTVKKYIDAGSNYFGNFEPFPFKHIDTEKLMVFSVSGVPFVGYIDYIGEEDGELVIVDNKSRDLKPRSKRAKPTQNDIELDEMLRQQYLYAFAVKQEYGKYPMWLCFNCFKNGVLIKEPFREEVLVEVIDWAKQSVENIAETEEFYPRVEYFSCRYICPYTDECCYWQGR